MLQALRHVHVSLVLLCGLVHYSCTTSSYDYDYVIVGGGVADMLLSERLSQTPNLTVLLLEAGPDGTESPLINTPALANMPGTTQQRLNPLSAVEAQH